MSSLNGRSVVVALDKERHLRYTFNALCTLQEQCGKTLDAMLTAQRLGFVELRAILWAGLTGEDPAITITAVGDGIQAFLETGGDIAVVMDKVVEALTVSGLLGKNAPGATSVPFGSPDSSTTPSVTPTDSSA